MNHEVKNKPLRLSARIWVAQLIYVVASLLLLAILLMSLDIGSVSASAARLFATIYVVMMIVANVIWRLAMSGKHTIIATVVVGATTIINIGIAQIFIVQSAHSSFDNYYKFRGCTELI